MYYICINMYNSYIICMSIFVVNVEQLNLNLNLKLETLGTYICINGRIHLKQSLLFDVNLSLYFDSIFVVAFLKVKCLNNKGRVNVRVITNMQAK